MIPPTEWPLGVQYSTVTTVTMRQPNGSWDPMITDRICLKDEAAQVIAQTMAQNPYATSYVAHTRAWRGVYGER